MTKTLSIIAVALLLVSVTMSAQTNCAWTNQPTSIVQTCGNVGIGTTNPQYQLHMIYNLNGSNPQVVTQNTSTGAGAAAGFQTLNDLGTTLSVGLTGSGFSGYGALGPNTASLYTVSPNGLVLAADNPAGALKFTTGGVQERMRLDASGHLGIGISAPVYRLHLLSTGDGISDGIRISSADFATSGAYLIINKDSGFANPATIQGGDNNAWAPLALNPNGGGVGIGLARPFSTLQVNGNVAVGPGTSGGVPGTSQLTTGGASPVANRLTFGTDGTGWEFAVSKNQAGAITDLLTIHDNGNVGIGTTTPPAQKLVIAGNAQLSTGGALYGNTTSQALALSSANGSKLSYDANNYMMVGGNIITFGNNPGEAMRIYNGKLGIGVAPAFPSSLLQVAGDVRLGSNGTNTDVTIFTDTPAALNGTAYNEINSITPVTVPPAGQTTHTALHLKNATAAGQGTNQVDLVVDGAISGASVIGAVYRDVAEWVSAGAELEPATVVVLNPAHEDQVVSSSTAYDTAVAGVVSEKPGVILGVGGAGKEKIATTGRVKVKVDATRAPIAIGDLLVTSDVPGTAMKSQPIDVGGAKMHRPGTVIGKALQPLPGGRGEILVLLSLQ